MSRPDGIPERVIAEAADPEAPSQQHWSLFWTFQSCFPKLCFQRELTQLSPPTERDHSFLGPWRSAHLRPLGG